MIIWQFERSVEPFRSMTVGKRNRQWEGWRQLSARESLQDVWVRPRVRFFEPGESGVVNEHELTRTDTDTPLLVPGLACVLSRRAADRMGELLLRYGELLPVDCDEGEFVIYHCMNQLDGALDMEHSEGGRARDGRLLSLKKPAFQPEAVRGQDVFTVVKPNPYTLFGSDRFVQLANASGLVGMRFVAVWREERTPEMPRSDVSIGCLTRRATGADPLPKKAAMMIQQTVAAAQRVISVDLGHTPLAEIVQKIQDAIDVNDPQSNQTIGEATLLAATLGTLWAEIICRELGWEWAWVREGDTEGAGIVSPTRSHVVFPQPFFYAQLAHRAHGPTSSELYRILKAGSVPPAERGSCFVLA